MSDAKARVSLSDGALLEFEGSESFVSSQIEKFTRTIQFALAPQLTTADDDHLESIAQPPVNTAASPDAPPEFHDIFAATESGVQILKAIPGASRAEKAVNGAKLYLYGLQVLRQRDTAWFEEIKWVCKANGCYDANNMAGYLKSDQQSFVFGGQGKKQTLKLSPPGLKSAQALVDRVRA